MKICIYGAGSIGGYLGAQLAESGQDVGLVARGAHLLALQKSGLRLEIGGKTITARVRATDNPETLGAQDVVFLTVKAPALAGAARGVAPLLGRDTVVVYALNGIPWWFAEGVGAPALKSADPDGALAKAI